MSEQAQEAKDEVMAIEVKYPDGAYHIVAKVLNDEEEGENVLSIVVDNPPPSPFTQDEQTFYHNGKFVHNSTGPSVIMKDGKVYYHLEGKLVTKEDVIAADDSGESLRIV